MANGTWVLIPSFDIIDPIERKQVYRTKLKSDGVLDKYKIRLVAKGYEKLEGIDYTKILSPIIKPQTIRTMFTLAFF